VKNRNQEVLTKVIDGNLCRGKAPAVSAQTPRCMILERGREFDPELFAKSTADFNA
jgi:hypothetical protein